MTSTASPTTHPAGSGSSPAGAFTSILNAAVGTVASKLERRVAGWTEKLNGMAAGGGSSDGLVKLADEGLDTVAEGGSAGQQAGAEGIKAGLHGANPIWAAIKGAWHSGSPVARAAIVAAVAAMILLLLVSPVVLLVFLVSLLIIDAVRRARPAKQ